MEESWKEPKHITELKSRLSRLNGYPWDTNNDMSVRFEDVES
jgi:hypothetical protein